MKRTILFLFVLSLLTVSPSAKPLRLLYWNIQNGMWYDQPSHYDNFVKFVSAQKPDICVWCEAQTLYHDGTDQGISDVSERYLPDNWDELALRYGHPYVYLAAHRDGYPQVITSRYPIRNVCRMMGEKPDSIVAHGAGWAQIDIKGRTYNIVTLHTWPMRYAPGAQDTKESAARFEGDTYRRTEMTYICRHTVLSHPDAADELWMMMGDFNSISPVDNCHYKKDENSSAFYVHNYIRQQTPYKDAVAELHPGQYIESSHWDSRIDFVYATPAMMNRIKSAEILRGGFLEGDKLGISNFYAPSDHFPILVEFR